MKHAMQQCAQFAVALSALLLFLTACGSNNADESPQSMDDYLARLSERYAEYYHIDDPPDIKQVRFVDTDEKQAVFESCLLEEGFEQQTNGGYMVPPAQEDAFNLASYICEMRYPLPMEYAREWGDEQLRIQYAWTIDFLIPCLEAEGHPINNVPSETTFIDTWSSNPFRPLAQVTPEVPAEQFNREWARLEQACPQQAPGSVLWDSESIEEWMARTGH